MQIVVAAHGTALTRRASRHLARPASGLHTNLRAGAYSWLMLMILLAGGNAGAVTAFHCVKLTLSPELSEITRG